MNIGPDLIAMEGETVTDTVGYSDVGTLDALWSYEIRGVKAFRSPAPVAYRPTSSRSAIPTKQEACSRQRPVSRIKMAGSAAPAGL